MSSVEGGLYVTSASPVIQGGVGGVGCPIAFLATPAFVLIADYRYGT